MKVLWCVTGAGYLLEETIAEMEKMSKKNEITTLFSNAGLEVARMYALYDRIKRLSKRVILEKDTGPSCPMSGTSKYDVLIVAPCTANTVAKIVHGIADTAITNIVAQFLKRKIRVIILPTDFKKEVKSKIPSGKTVTIHSREVDLENFKRLKKIKNTDVVTNPKKIELRGA